VTALLERGSTRGRTTADALCLRATTGKASAAGLFHVAIIMDGSGRWAAAHHRPRIEGHRAGAQVVRRIVEAAPSLGIGTLTLFAFSSDNWKRPPEEVQALMQLLRDFLRDFTASAIAKGIRLDVIGRRDRLAPELLAAAQTAVEATRGGQKLFLRLAIDYSGRDSILQAVREIAGTGMPQRQEFLRVLARVNHATQVAPEVDLLVRTGGEQRLSDFMLWESAYAELYFMRKKWPDVEVSDLARAVEDFRRRERRFGSVPAALATGGPGQEGG
jgi:undecaprenyl diphosphate synthase